MAPLRTPIVPCVAIFLAVAASAMAQGVDEQPATATTQATTQASAGMITLQADQHGYRGFDRLVHGDYVKAAMGDDRARERLRRACDGAIADDARHAEAIAWRGAARMFDAAAASDGGDFMAAMNHVNAALNDLKAARELEPENPGVRLIAAQTLLSLAANHPIEAMAKNYAKQGIEDATIGFRALHDRWDHQPAETKGRLMTEVARAYEKLGQTRRARDWYNRVIGAVPGSEWAGKAQARIDAMDRLADEL